MIKLNRRKEKYCWRKENECYMNYYLIRDVYVHSLMVYLHIDEYDAKDIFYSYYDDYKLKDLRNLIIKMEREVTQSE